MSTLSNLYEVLVGSNGGFVDIHSDSFLPGWLLTPEYVWIWAAVGSVLVGLSGVLPLLVIPIDQKDNLRQGDSANKLKLLLSFAVGGLLGDVFLHSLPEIFTEAVAQTKHDTHASYSAGLLILAGVIAFIIIEKLGKLAEQKMPPAQNNNIEESKKHISGYLNLIANFLDNFLHGLSLGGAFLMSLRSGLLTTFAILMHEIPHEVGDFAVLLKAGFSRWDAAVFQLLTAGGGLVGASTAILSNSIDAKTSWILPFTTGTFLYMALVAILPDLIQEADWAQSIKQIISLLGGILVMAMVATVG